MDYNVKSSDCESIIMLETIHVLRVKATRDETYDRFPDYAKSEEIKKRINERIKNFVDAITAWEYQNKVYISDITSSVGDFMKEAFIHMFAYWGEIRQSEKCGSCKERLDSPQYYYYGLGQLDFQHVMLAKLDLAS